jgi:hypothetical protein
MAMNSVKRTTGVPSHTKEKFENVTLITFAYQWEYTILVTSMGIIINKNNVPMA